jgi:molybdopterin-guanine dinucleotide biosynthesis protein B
MIMNARIPVLGFAAFSGTGKTTLLCNLLPLLRSEGLRIGMVKHAHHSFEVDHPGKDSYELRKAGASQMLVASRQRWALMVETASEAEPRLGDLLARLDQSELDLVLVEGFKREQFPKIELHRSTLGYPLLFPQDPEVIAIATDAPLGVEADLPVLDINVPWQIAQFVLAYARQGPIGAEAAG